MGTVASFSLKHYEHMVDVGAFTGEFQQRIELLGGEIVMMSPIGPEHHHCLMLLTDWSYQVVPLEQIAIGVQGPIRIPESDSEPEPDLVWLARRDFSGRHPEPHEVKLLVEVADTSLEADRTEKLSIYAEANIREYWIVNLVDKQIEIYRDPSGMSYQQRLTCQGDEVVYPLALPQAKLAPSQIFRTKENKG